MAIASVSSGSHIATAPVRTNTELVKKEIEDTDKKVSERDAVEKREGENKLEDAKGVKEVDTKA